eukprot:Nk52_evm1s2409 gene=Nk52_evmTU1s2409
MTDLLQNKKDVPFSWTEDCEQELVSLKRACMKQTALVTPDYAKPFYIHADSSDFALGAVLLQKDDSGALRPVSFISRKLNAAE